MESACVELSLALLAKLSEGELVDWLRAAAHWAAAGPDGSLPSKDGSLVASPEDEDASSRRRKASRRSTWPRWPNGSGSSRRRASPTVLSKDWRATSKGVLAIFDKRTPAGAGSASAMAEVVAHLPESWTPTAATVASRASWRR